MHTTRNKVRETTFPMFNLEDKKNIKLLIQYWIGVVLPLLYSFLDPFPLSGSGYVRDYSIIAPA